MEWSAEVPCEAGARCLVQLGARCFRATLVRRVARTHRRPQFCSRGRRACDATRQAAVHDDGVDVVCANGGKEKCQLLAHVRALPKEDAQVEEAAEESEQEEEGQPLVTKARGCQLHLSSVTKSGYKGVTKKSTGAPRVRVTRRNAGYRRKPHVRVTYKGVKPDVGGRGPTYV